ncbi:MAG TPA: hypothetical protein DD648_01160 [Candidatus Omnitrophica bacterium]|nr:hypothetical protein [Candidatus Omnitrophota bacterium]
MALIGDWIGQQKAEFFVPVPGPPRDSRRPAKTIGALLCVIYNREVVFLSPQRQSEPPETCNPPVDAAAVVDDDLIEIGISRDKLFRERRDQDRNTR